MYSSRNGMDKLCILIFGVYSNGQNETSKKNKRGIMYFIQDMAEEFIIRRNTHPLTQTQTQKARY